MYILRNKYQHVILIVISLFLSSCASFQKIEGVSDYSQIILQKDDKVKVEMSDGRKVEFILTSVDTDYFYGKDGERIKKGEITKLEFNRPYTSKFYIVIIGYLIFASQF